MRPHPRRRQARPSVPFRLVGRLLVVLLVDARRAARAELAAARLHAGGPVGGARPRGGDRRRQLGAVAAADPDRPAVHRRHTRARGPGAERRDRPGRVGAARRRRDRGLLGGAGGRARHDDPDDGDRRRARARPRRPLVPPRHRPPGPPLEAGRGDRRARRRVPRDRRARARRPAAGDARRQRARARALGARARLPARALGDRLVLADRRLPGRAAARQQLRHARVPLVGEGQRPRDRHQPPEGRGRDRAPPVRRPRAAVRRRGEPGQHPLRRRAAQHAHDEHGARPRPPGPARAGLLRLLRQPVWRRTDRAAGDRRDLHRALLGHPAGPPRRPAADQAQLRVRARALVRDRDPARPAGRGRHVRRARRPARDLHDVPGLRRGRAPLRDRAPGHAGGPAAGRPRDRADRRGRPARPAALRADRALRSRPESGRDVPAALRRRARGRRQAPFRRRGPRRGRPQRRRPGVVQRQRGRGRVARHAGRTRRAHGGRQADRGAGGRRDACPRSR